ncbi:MarR family transcriptional regulator, partial [Klebsiella pneumoniae]
MALVLRLCRAFFVSAFSVSALSLSCWSVLLLLLLLGDLVSVSVLAVVQGFELPPLVRSLSFLVLLGFLVRSSSPFV